MAVEKGLPLIVVKGTGKAADLIAECLNEDEFTDELLKERAPVYFGTTFNTSNFNQLKKDINTIIKKKWLIKIYDVDSDNPMKMSQIAGEVVTCAWAMANVSDESKEKNADYKNEGSVTITRKIIKRSYIPEPEVIPDDDNTPSPFNYEPESDATKNISKQERQDDNPSCKQRASELKKAYTLDTKFASPPSLPLYFYFAYQLFEEEIQTGGQFRVSQKTLLLEALKANRADYVQVLLDQGVGFEKTKLQILYKSTVSCCDFTESCLHIQWILKQADRNSAKKLLTRQDTSDKDLDKMQRNRSLKGGGCEIDEIETRGSSMKLCRSILGYKDFSETKKNQIRDSSERKQVLERKSILEELLLWSLFANRSEISEIMWLKTDNHLLTAIVCSVILAKMSKKANNVKEEQLSRSLIEHSVLFEKRCLMMMDQMYECDPDISIEIANADAEIFGIRSSPLTFAHENYMYEVIAHPCTQRFLNKEWYNGLSPDFKPFVKSLKDHPGSVLGASFTIFMFHYIFFLGMLVCYSSYVMTSVDDTNYNRAVARLWEYYVYFWGAGDFLEEIISTLGICQTGGRSHRGYMSRLKRYMSNFWNFMDLLSYFILIAALFMRHFVPSDTYNGARRLFSLSLLIMYLRFLQIFLIHRRLGPTLIMIKEMLKDLLYFLSIAVVVVIGVGVFYHANLFPNHLAIFGPGTVDTWSFWKILYYPYWQMYGEGFNEYLEGKDLTDCVSNFTAWNLDQSQERCPQSDWSVPLVSAIYMLISNLLLVNLVIAMFSYTFNEVQKNSEKLWRFQRYTVITDYASRYPSPLNLFIRPVQVIIWIKSFHCCSSKTSDKKDITEHLTELQKIFAGRCRNSKSF